MYLPEVKDLKESLLEIGNEEFKKKWVNRYQKADAIIGSIESSEFIKQFLNMEYNENTEADKKANN